MKNLVKILATLGLIVAIALILKGVFGIGEIGVKKISKNRKLRLLDINEYFNQLKKISLSLTGEFQLKNLSMAILAARLCNLSDAKIYKVFKKMVMAFLLVVIVNGSPEPTADMYFKKKSVFRDLTHSNKYSASHFHNYLF